MAYSIWKSLAWVSYFKPIRGLPAMTVSFVNEEKKASWHSWNSIFRKWLYSRYRALCLRILPSKLSQSLRKAALTSRLMHACMKILLKSASVVKYSLSQRKGSCAWWPWKFTWGHGQISRYRLQRPTQGLWTIVVETVTILVQVDISTSPNLAHLISTLLG